jgi:exodeoxyribonuclease-5
MSKLLDQAARTTALTDLERSFMVEAGAGSGKTSLMAGRVASLLASGVSPSSIAAISFTEMAASELQNRIVSFIQRLLEKNIPPDLKAAFPKGLSAHQQHNLEAALTYISEITCTTIHGFCQRLLKPYPVEANIDPGAKILDPIGADLMFDDVFTVWMRDRLSETNSRKNLLTSIVSHDPYGAVTMIKELAAVIRNHRDAEPDPVAEQADAGMEFVAAVEQFAEFLQTFPFKEADTEEIVKEFDHLSKKWTATASLPEHLRVMSIIGHSVSETLVKKTDGEFRAYKVKGKWQKVAPKGHGERINDEATAHYTKCSESFSRLRRYAAARGLLLLVDEIRPLLDLYQENKRKAALLDFDDLLISTRRMLRDHQQVKNALSERFSRILVDEFQDTDPIQTEIVRHLAFDAPSAGTNEWAPRPGAIFLVGDPKQAIYRFRGADVKTYLTTRDSMKVIDPSSILEVGTNFRSCESVLEYVNSRFEEPLSAPLQPGFGRLNHHRADHEQGACVASIQIPSADSASHARMLEADAVADLCARLIGSYDVVDGETGQTRPCEPGDIALLTPTGTELWRYETALESVGLAVATQAGKSMLQRQEVQDLIGLTRILADPRDRLAFGAFLRGPVVGLSEEELLDISHALPSSEEGEMAYLNVDTDPALIKHDIASGIIAKLADLRRRANSMTPYDILSEAIEELQIRPVLVARHDGAAERSLANVDRFLEMSRSYDVRGLRAFSDAMRLAWEDNERFGEGRPDAEEQSISLITMHSAKGLEWPIVIQVNALTEVMRPSRILFDVSARRMSMPFFGIDPEGYLDAKIASNDEQHAERVRLWYVAMTRARDLLIIPKHDPRNGKASENTWTNVLNLDLDGLPLLDMSEFEMFEKSFGKEVSNVQDEATFEAEQERVMDRRRPVVWESPSRREEMKASVSEELSEDDIIDAVPDFDPSVLVRGSAQRGNILHKMMEEVVTGEISDFGPSLDDRAAELVTQIESDPVKAKALELDHSELARCIRRTVKIKAVSELLDRLVPEVVVGRSIEFDHCETVIYGVADAVAFANGKSARTTLEAAEFANGSGIVDVVVDWKSDVNPSKDAIQHYRDQVRSYMKSVKAKRGLIVLMTSGEVIEVTPLARQAA